MKVAVSTDGRSLGSQVSPVFGRCPYFLIVDIVDGEIEDSDVLENSAMNQSSGAGTAASQLIGEEGADLVISGAVGPKAFSALRKWEIDVYEAEPGTVEENIERLLSEELKSIEEPSGPAGMGMGGSKSAK